VVVRVSPDAVRPRRPAYAAATSSSASANDEVKTQATSIAKCGARVPRRRSAAQGAAGRAVKEVKLRSGGPHRLCCARSRLIDGTRFPARGGRGKAQALTAILRSTASSRSTSSRSPAAPDRSARPQFCLDLRRCRLSHRLAFLQPLKVRPPVRRPRRSKANRQVSSGVGSASHRGLRQKRCSLSFRSSSAGSHSQCPFILR